NLDLTGAPNLKTYVGNGCKTYGFTIPSPELEVLRLHQNYLGAAIGGTTDLAAFISTKSKINFISFRSNAVGGQEIKDIITAVYNNTYTSPTKTLELQGQDVGYPYPIFHSVRGNDAVVDLDTRIKI